MLPSSNLVKMWSYELGIFIWTKSVIANPPGADMQRSITIKRVYEPQGTSDGERVLVDRLWPRGRRREELYLSSWLRAVAPSTALRRELHQQRISHDEFVQRYREELTGHPEEVTPLLHASREGALTLLTAARNPEQSHAQVLRQHLIDMLDQEDAQDREPASPVCYSESFPPQEPKINGGAS